MRMKKLGWVSTVVVVGLSAQAAHAAVALDRTRVIYNGSDKSMSLSIENKNKSLPYLAQSWLEDANGEKVSSPLTALPPIQRLEPGAKSQVKLQSIVAAAHALPQDRESLFYFNLREIPPKSDKPNTLQIALQTRIKLFYRPEALAISTNYKPYQEGLTLTRTGKGYTVNNPTPYYVTVINAAKSVNAPGSKDFKPLMIAPKGQLPLESTDVGEAPVLTYINDFGGRPKLVFNCSGSTCKVARSEKG